MQRTPRPAAAGIIVDPVVRSRTYAPTDHADEWKDSAIWRDGSLFVCGTRSLSAHSAADVIVAR